MSKEKNGIRAARETTRGSEDLREKLGYSPEQWLQMEIEQATRAPAAMLHDKILTDIDRLLRTACIDNKEGDDAGLYLIEITVRLCHLLRDAATTKGVQSIIRRAPKMTKWPVVHSLFYEGEVNWNAFLETIALGSEAEIRHGKWRITSVSARWAVAYWMLVDFCKRAGAPDHDPQAACERIKRIYRREMLEGDFADAVKLPPLSKSDEVLAEWRRAYKAHVQRHHPGHSIVNHEDWKNVKQYRVQGKDTAWRANKIVGEIMRAMKRVARPAQVVTPQLTGKGHRVGST